MVDIMVRWVQGIIDGIVQLGNNGALSQGLEHFNPVVYSKVEWIYQNVTLPIGIALIGLFILLEFLNMTQRTGMNGMLGAELPIKSLIKFVVCYTFLTKSFELLVMIFNVNLEIITQISKFGTIEIFSIDIEGLKAALNDVGFFGQIGAGLQIFFFWVVSLLATGFAQIMITLRMLELYLYLAICPLPFATLPHNELSSVGKNFIKSFTAVALQGVLMYLLMNVLSMIMSSIGSIEDIYETLWQCMFYSLLVAFSLSGTSRLAKSICNAM